MLEQIQYHSVSFYLALDCCFVKLLRTNNRYQQLFSENLLILQSSFIHWVQLVCISHIPVSGVLSIATAIEHRPSNIVTLAT